MDARTVLAAVLGVGLGFVLIAYPEAVVRAQTAGRLPRDRGGEYGEDAGVSSRTRWIVQALGVLSVLLGFYFAWGGLT